LFTAKGGVKKVIIEAVVTRSDGTVEDLGKIAEIKKPVGLIGKMKSGALKKVKG